MELLWSYYSVLIFTFIGLVFLFACLWYMYRRKKKEGNSYKLDNGTVVVTVFFIFLAGYLFVIHLLDLPDVLANKTEQYKGNCEVSRLESRRTSYTMVHFGNYKVTFPLDYQGAKEGSYYCEVSYYPQTETGASLKLYDSRGQNK
ncbi:hypothetical protein QWY14_04145 [Planococcus sp. N028]|uniref:Uncharacterized protein n=1 Tax=Planococcus shixiaomingii TaxID=3058393 RepID=A0ABT8N087_9BACL|nr:hypothetical protein [Planococcus sp. N028]MDN7240965.1 hypothetical protein [Planococcus sp. N028]